MRIRETIIPRYMAVQYTNPCIAFYEEKNSVLQNSTSQVISPDDNQAQALVLMNVIHHRIMPFQRERSKVFYLNEHQLHQRQLNNASYLSTPYEI